MSISRLLNIYEKTTNGELEFRSKLDSKSMINIISNMINSTATIEQSINFISNIGNDSRIYKLLFSQGVKKTPIYMKKSRLGVANIKSSIPFKLVLAKEELIKPFSINLSKMARVKLRLSLRHDKFKDWRFDFTLSRSVRDITRDLKSAKTSMLFKIDVKDFIQSAPWNNAETFEFEIEHIGNKKVEQREINELVNFTNFMLDPNYENKNEYQDKITWLSGIIKSGKKINYKRGLRSLYNVVKEVNKSDYYKVIFPNIKDYLLLEKADGIRTIVIFNGDTMTCLSGDITKKSLNKTHDKISVCDAEMVDGKLYVFDMIMFEGKKLVDYTTEERIAYIPQIIEKSEEHLIAKKIVSLTEQYRQEIKELWEGKHPFPVDGLIFTPKDKTYSEMVVWKWKPLSHLSIDFMVKKAPNSKNMLYLFSGINRKLYDKLRLSLVVGYDKLFPNQKIYNYFPIQFSPSDNPFVYKYVHEGDTPLKDIVNQVVEFNWDIKKKKWKILKIRHDKKADVARGNYYGNDFYVAEYTWQNFQNPLYFEDLIISHSDYMNIGYFRDEKTSIYKPMTGFNSFVKGQLLKPYANSKWAVDLAGGRGADMFRISKIKIENALFMDVDSNALSELIIRKHDFERGITRLNTRIFTKIADLRTPHKKIIASIKKNAIPVGKIDVAMCNFAIHYLVGTPKYVRNIIQLVHSLLKDGGKFFFTTFNGQHVFDKLKGKKEWIVREGEILKYSIKKMYKSDTFAETGQQIGVIHPFNRTSHTTEYLVNYDYLLGEFEKAGFKIVRKGGFGDFFEEYKNISPSNFAKLTEDDKEYISLYGYAVLVKELKYTTKCFIDKTKGVEKFVPETKIEFIPYDKKIWQRAFPGDDALHSKLLLTNVGIYSIAKTEHVSVLTNYLKKKWTGDMSVLDCNGGMGGLSLGLSKYMSVTTLEITPEHAKVIENNASVYKRKIKVIQDDLMNYMENTDAKYDFIIFDPPWGGEDYHKQKSLKLGFNNVNIWCIINKYIDRAKKAFILWAPFNFDLKDFKKNVNIKDIKIVKTQGRHYWIVLHKF